MKSTYNFNLNTKGTKDIGFLVPLELGKNISFEIKRIFYTYGMPQNRIRGDRVYNNTE